MSNPGDFNLLVVDDDVLTLTSIQKDLEEEGYSVTPCRSGREAMELLTERPYDLVITDLLIDEIGGLDILKWVKRENPETVVMILSGHEDPTLVIDALRLDAGEFVTKPYDPGEFIFRVRNCIIKVETFRAIRKAEQEYRRLASAVEQLAEIIIITSCDGTVIYANDAVFTVTGYSKEVIIGRNLKEAGFRITGMNSSTEDLWRTVESGNVWKGVIAYRKRGGGTCETEATITPVFDRDGRIINFVSVERDVTHEKELERQVRQSRKMEAIGTLAGGIAHDFNNILGAIIGYTEMSLENVPIGSYLHNNLKQILKASSRAANLVSQILAFSRSKKQEKKPIQISLIIKEVLKMLRSTIPSSIEIRQSIEGANVYVMTEPTEIHQILINLCTNAAQAIGNESGVVEVSTEVVEVDRSGRSMVIPSKDLKSGSYYHIRVKDNGEGMEERVQERIFDPFFTTKKVGEGTGLGLSMVHGIVKEHEGDIYVVSEKGKGTQMHVLLPLAEQTLSEERKRIPKIKGGKGRILVVDDEESLVLVQKEMLESLGYEVVAETSSPDALLLFQRAPQFDLVITDQIMPNVNGIKLAEEILRINPSIPIILTTGYTDSLTEEEVLSRGIRKLIYKPVRKRDLAINVCDLLEK